MRKENIQVLDRFMTDIAKKYGITGQKHIKEGSVVSMYSNLEEYHLFTTICSDMDVQSLDLQYSVYVEDKMCRIQIFVDPIMLSEGKIKEACILANEINLRMKIPGTFEVDSRTGDFLLDICFTEKQLELMPEHVEETLFDSALDFWRAVHIPFIMYAKDLWKIDTAVDYLRTLVDQGWIDNAPYGL